MFSGADTLLNQNQPFPRCRKLVEPDPVLYEPTDLAESDSISSSVPSLNFQERYAEFIGRERGGAGSDPAEIRFGAGKARAADSRGERAD